MRTRSNTQEPASLASLTHASSRAHRAVIDNFNFVRWTSILQNRIHPKTAQQRSVDEDSEQRTSSISFLSLDYAVVLTSHFCSPLFFPSVTHQPHWLGPTSNQLVLSLFSSR